MDAVQRYERLSVEPFASIESPRYRFGTFTRSIVDIYQHREVLSLLVRRDIKARYKNSVLGVLWTLIKPVTQLIMYYVVMGLVFQAAKGVPQFAVYIFSGLTIFTLFSEILSSTTGSVVGNSGLVKKVYLPREIFPLASVGVAIFNFAVQLLVLIAASIGFGTLKWDLNLLYFFPSTIVIITYGLALGLVLSALNVYMRDIQYITEVVLMFVMWGSPIVYSWTMITNAMNTLNAPAWLLDVYTNNPLTLAVLGFQRAFWQVDGVVNGPENLGFNLFIAFLVGLVLLWLAHMVFRRLQGNFAQEL